jgi:hypothetical protein
MQACADVGRITTILYICPHTTIYQTYRILYIYVLKLLYTRHTTIYICPHTTIYMCLHTTFHWSSYYYAYICPHATIYLSSYDYMCPHTTVHTSVGKAASAGARWRGQHLLFSPVLQSGLLRFSGMRTYIQ